MRQSGIWGDTAILQCLACAFDVDICVLIHGQPDPALVGPSCAGSDDCELLCQYIVMSHHGHEQVFVMQW